MTGRKSSLISIGLATCNGAQTLRRALDSICLQTCKDVEIIVSDNASTDETEAICREYEAKDSRVRFFRQKENIGAVKNYLFVLERAQGKYFMWATDDDWYDQKFIEELVEKLEAHPECGVAMSSFERRFPDGKLKDRVLLTGELALNGRSHLYTFKKMIAGFPIHVYFYGLFRREFLLRLTSRGFPKCIRPDRVFMVEAALAAKFASVEPVLYYKTRSYDPPEKITLDERYSPDAIQEAFQSPLAQTKYLLNLLTWPLSSRLVPLSRKAVVPFYWMCFAVKKRRAVAREIYGLILPSSWRLWAGRTKDFFREVKKNLPLLGDNLPLRLMRLIKVSLGGRVLGRLDYEKRRIFMSVSSFLQLGRLRACRKEPETVAWIESFVKPGDTFYDIGANVGAYSFVAWAVAGEKSKIFAFEPGAPTFAALKKNIELNNASNSITAYKIACTDKTGTFTFHYRSKKPGDASHALTKEGELPDEKFKAAAREEIKGFAVDDFIVQSRLSRPNHIKIDVDGSELAVIRGAVGTLKYPGLRSILIEIDEKRAEAGEIMTILENAGFRPRSKHRRGSARKRVFNYIFVR